MGQVFVEQPWKVNSQLDFGKDVNWTGDGLVEIAHLQFYYGTAPLKKVCTKFRNKKSYKPNQTCLFL
jgi:hypothetical protein